MVGGPMTIARSFPYPNSQFNFSLKDFSNNKTYNANIDISGNFNFIMDISGIYYQYRIGTYQTIGTVSYNY